MSRTPNSNVRSYTAKGIINRVRNKAKGFISIPKGDMLVVIRSREDEYNVFDDKAYLFNNGEFIRVYECTSNAGAKGLMGFESYNKLGVAMLQGDRIVYNSHKRGLSKGRKCFRQVKGFPYTRDNNKNKKNEEIGKVYDNIIYAHIHDAKMSFVKKVFKKFINGWSLACIVLNNGFQWNEFFYQDTTEDTITLCILKEFDDQ